MGRESGPRVVRLFGHLGERELQHVIAAIRERGRSPRDLVCLDFEQVTHVDYRALSGFARALTRQANTGADICLGGLSSYGLPVFGVSSQGPALSRLEWTP